MLLLAPFLQNPNRPPVKDAAVWVEGNTVLYSGARGTLPPEAREDPEKLEIPGGVLFPGLINAHCHLELTALFPFDYPGDFVQWIRKILAAKNSLTLKQLSNSLPLGVLQCIMGGTTTIGDHLSVDGDLETLLNSPLRGKIFLEILGVVPEVARDIFAAAQSLRKAFEDKETLFDILPSPHSVHTLDPGILSEVLCQNLPLYSLHISESEAEAEYFRNSSGPLKDLIAERGVPLSHTSSSAARELRQQNLLNDRILVIHGNYLDEEELSLLAERRISIVHCPLSHQYFGHRPFPINQALARGVNLALGTDSLASASSLSMLEVLRQTQKNFPEISREKIFSMATLGGAKALKMETSVGEITSGKKADIVAVPMNRASDPLEAIFSADVVGFSMINGVILAR